MSATFKQLAGNAVSGVSHSLEILTTSGTEDAQSLPVVSATGDNGFPGPLNGLGLGGLAAFGLHLLAQGAGSFTSGYLRAWYFDPVVRVWSRCPDLDKAVVEGFQAMAFVPTPVGASQGWLVYLPADVGCAVKITLSGCMRRI